MQLEGDGGGRGLAPFEKHPASPEAIEGNAGELAGQANTTLDAEQTTKAAFDPAVDNWDGLCAAELRAAPEPVRRGAFDLASNLTWAAVPLRYWAAQVRTFNARVDAIVSALDGQGPHYGAKGENGKPPTDEAIMDARTAATATAAADYLEAESTYITDGATTAVGMFRDGPTLQNVKKAEDVGAIPTTPGAFTVFPAYWHERNMKAEAHRAAQVAQKIIDDPSYRPTGEELALLERTLNDYKYDPAFSTAFLNEIGPNGLLQLTGNLAMLQPDASGRGVGIDEDLADTVGSIQQSLGSALAVATTQLGRRNQLSYDWVGKLMSAGRQKMSIGDGGAVDEPGADVYGYQLVGVLLNRGVYSPSFLNLVGDDMLDFERENLSADGLPPWADTMRAGERGGYTLRLNWIDGHDAKAPAGYDPVAGLMGALSRNDEAAKQFFTSEETFDGTGGGRLTKVDYLLTDRKWFGDYTRDEYPGSLDGEYGEHQLGLALEAATTSHPDQRSADIVESIVFEVANDEKAHGDKFQSVALIPPAARESMANIMKTWIGDVHQTMAGRDVLPSGDVDPVTPGVQTVGATFDRTDLTRFLADVGKDQDARRTVWDAEIAYSAASHDHYLTAHPMDAKNWIDTTAAASGRVFGSLDFGSAAADHETTQNEDQRHNDQAAAGYKVAGALIDYGLGKAAPVLGPVAGPLAGHFVDAILGGAEEAAQQDHTGQTNYDVGELRGHGRQAAELLAEAAVYRHTPVDQLPPALVEHGRPLPMSQWDEDAMRAWEGYVESNGLASAARTEGAAGYDAGYGAAKDDLQQWN